MLIEAYIGCFVRFILRFSAVSHDLHFEGSMNISQRIKKQKKANVTIHEECRSCKGRNGCGSERKHRCNVHFFQTTSCPIWVYIQTVWDLHFTCMVVHKPPNFASILYENRRHYDMSHYI